MEVTALCVGLLIDVSMLLVAQIQSIYCAQNTGVGSPRVVPSSLQLFEYESVSFTCEVFDGSSGWRVMRKIAGTVSTCVTDWGTLSTSACAIKIAYPTDSGEYWCEGGGGERSNAVNISVSGGAVILESPALPVMEGDTATLRCRNKDASSNITADFYKDGVLVASAHSAEMTVHNVSTDDEGLYKCSISGRGESAENRLTVREFQTEQIWSRPSLDQSSVLLFLLMKSVLSLLLMALMLAALSLCDNKKC